MKEHLDGSFLALALDVPHKDEKTSVNAHIVDCMKEKMKRVVLGRRHVLMVFSAHCC